MFTRSTTFMPNQISLHSKIPIIFHNFISCDEAPTARKICDEVAASIRGAEEIVYPERVDGTVEGEDGHEAPRILNPEAGDKGGVPFTRDRGAELLPATAAEPPMPGGRAGGK